VCRQVPCLPLASCVPPVTLAVRAACRAACGGCLPGAALRKHGQTRCAVPDRWLPSPAVHTLGGNRYCRLALRCCRRGQIWSCALLPFTARFLLPRTLSALTLFTFIPGYVPPTVQHVPYLAKVLCAACYLFWLYTVRIVSAGSSFFDCSCIPLIELSYFCLLRHASTVYST
jgi:hypothetical protein